MSDRTDLVDMLNACRYKLAFLIDAFAQPHQPEPELSKDGWSAQALGRKTCSVANYYRKWGITLGPQGGDQSKRRVVG